MLLSRREFPPLPDGDPVPSNTSDSSTSPRSPDHSLPSSPSPSPVSSPRQTGLSEVFDRELSLPSPRSPHVVCIEVFSNTSQCGMSLDVKPLTSLATPVNLLTLELPSDNACSTSIFPEDQHRIRLPRSNLFGNVIPSVSFSSATPVHGSYRSMYCVFLDDNLVHSEVTDLVSLPPHYSFGSLYRTHLIPDYWKTLTMMHGEPLHHLPESLEALITKQYRHLQIFHATLSRRILLRHQPSRRMRQSMMRSFFP